MAHDQADPRARSFLHRPIGCWGAVLLGGCCITGMFSMFGAGTRPPPTAHPRLVPPVVSTPVAGPVDAPQSVAPTTTPVYRVLREEPSETRDEAQLDGRLLVDPALTPDELRAVLAAYLRTARARAGWRRHERTTDVYAYAYASEADANGSGTGWVAMLTWASESGEDREADVSIDEAHLEAARHPVEREGLPEPRRREIARALWDLDYASARAGRDEDDANARRVARRFHVSEETVRAIGIEATMRGW